MQYFLILPNQLFESKYLDKKYDYILWECPHYFKDYRYNKKKLLLHRASMKFYYDALKKKGYKIRYVEFNKPIDTNAEYTMFNPLNKPEILQLPNHITIIDSPNILMTKAYLEEYRTKTKKFFFNAFYMWSKRKLGIIPGIKSQDKLNRKRLTQSQSMSIHQPYDNQVSDTKYVQEAKQYVQKHFKENPGNLDNFIFPISHSEAQKWLDHFIKHKLKNFGPYQDFIDKDNKHLYHSLLSALINIGLLNPIDVINKLPKKGIPINSYEGFIRQLFWREYQYYCYVYFDFNQNYFGNTKKLDDKWYSGNTGILPVDDAVIEAFDSGYLHHIKRLMVVGNYMNLSGISPKEGFRWFMEFSCDSYEWVMHQNVYEMVFFISGGNTMRRPYISSSNYILKMSNYKKEDWCHEWDAKYRDFVKKHKQKLWKFRYYFGSL